MRAGDAGLVGSPRPWRPVRTLISPAGRVEGALVAHHGEGDPIGALAERTTHHAFVLAASAQLVCVAGEVRVALAQRLAEIDDRLSELDLALARGVGTGSLLAGGLVELGD